MGQRQVPGDFSAGDGALKKRHKNGTILYFSVFEWPSEGKIVIPELKNKVVSAKLLANGIRLKTSLGKDGTLTIGLPAAAPDPAATVIKIDVRGKI